MISRELSIELARLESHLGSGRASEFGNNFFAAAEGHLADLIQDERKRYPRDGGENHKDQRGEPDFAVGARCEKSECGEPENDDLNAEAREYGGIRCALAAKRPIVDLFR